MKKLLIIIATALCLASCSKENAESSLSGTKWMGEHYLLVFDSSSVCRIGYYMDDGEFSLQPARGQYRYENGHIEFFGLVYQTIFCPEEFYSAEVKGDSMTISYIREPSNPFSIREYDTLKKIK